MTWNSFVLRRAAYFVAAVGACHACHPVAENTAPGDADSTPVAPSFRAATRTAVAAENTRSVERTSIAALNRTAPNRTALNQTALNQTALNQTALNQTALNQTALNQTALNEIATVSSEEPANAPPLDACQRAGFFDFYRNARLITTDTPELVQLQIHIDYHTGAGCIAPDGFGTDLIVKLHLRTADGECFIDSAEVRAVDWGLHERRTSDLDERKLRFDFTAFDVLQRPALTRSDTGAFALHSSKYAVSLLVRRGGLLWYEGTNATSVLHTAVDSQGDKNGCCWPATSTYYREFGVYD